MPQVLQQFIKSRGPRASVYRVQLSSARDEAHANEPRLRGWNISNKEDFQPYISSNTELADKFSSLEDIKQYIRRNPAMDHGARDLAITEAADVSASSLTSPLLPPSS